MPEKSAFAKSLENPDLEYCRQRIHALSRELAGYDPRMVAKVFLEAAIVQAASKSENYIPFLHWMQHECESRLQAWDKAVAEYERTGTLP